MLMCIGQLLKPMGNPLKGLTLCCVMSLFLRSFLVLQVDIFFTYYPKRLGQVVMVDAPFIFKPGCDVLQLSLHRNHESVPVVLQCSGCSSRQAA
jgi:hypothetical protein